MWNNHKKSPQEQYMRKSQPQFLTNQLRRSPHPSPRRERRRTRRQHLPVSQKKSRSASVWNPDEDERFSQQIEEPAFESPREVPADRAVPADSERLEEFSTPMSKKDKKDKKDKKGKRKSVVTREPDAFDMAMKRIEQQTQGRANPSNT